MILLCQRVAFGVAEVEVAEVASSTRHAVAVLRRSRYRFARSIPDIGVHMRGPQLSLSDDSRDLYFRQPPALVEADIFDLL
ncbi:hypothetical protein EVAR_64086_1 [Eumeta japonica]|uniref:Uncharacterized protein n=1 Tax=Eumeta variegata TaxID=151549 RepID=A0A4C1ZEH4_EUMVA|nr:hypothetical protein EVAR_64086_1 [Eumeta japonica]